MHLTYIKFLYIKTTERGPVDCGNVSAKVFCCIHLTIPYHRLVVKVKVWLSPPTFVATELLDDKRHMGSMVEKEVLTTWVDVLHSLLGYSSHYISTAELWQYRILITHHFLWFIVPVHLLTSSTTATTPPAPTGSTTAIGYPDSYGCTIDSTFYADGAQVR